MLNRRPTSEAPQRSRVGLWNDHARVRLLRQAVVDGPPAGVAPRLVDRGRSDHPWCARRDERDGQLDQDGPAVPLNRWLIAL